MKMLILLPIFFPIIIGACLLISSFREHIVNGSNEDYADKSEKELRMIHIISILTLFVSSFVAIYVGMNQGLNLTLFNLTKNLPIYFQVDSLSLLFVSFMSIVFCLVTIYSCTYMKHEKEEKRFFGFLLVVFGVLMALDFAGNLITFYFFYEFMTLTSMPFVLHNGSHEAIMASLKYLFYSMCGAYLSLFGIFVLNQFTTSLTFSYEGTLNLALASQNKGLILIALFCMLIGFGAKAGMFPLHAWLPTAHPVAPTGGSALLSSIIVKCGVLGIIRVVYYIVGVDFVIGSWVHYAWIILSLMTIFMGSLLAYKEPILKKRLAYSTVSQVSYILFGLAVMSYDGMCGSLLHVVFHVFIKCGLFLIAGIFIYNCHITKVEDLRGIGKSMPLTLWCFTFLSLALIGIPPTSGFISKWYLALGALNANIGIFRYLGPIVLLLSALLTAGYLLEITMIGFFPGTKAIVKYQKVSKSMLIPVMILTILSVLLGVFPNSLIHFISEIVSPLF